MQVVRRAVGDVEVIALLDGEADVEPITEAFPETPRDELLREPGVLGAGDRWHLFVRAWVLLHPEGVALVDTGVGGPGSPALEWFPHTGGLPDALREAGTSPDQIDTVILTHVHSDHVGGTVTGDPPVPAFPRARYLIQRADVDFARELADTAEDDRALWERLLQPLLAAGVVQELDGDHRLAGTIELHHAPGHTPGHQMVRVASRSDRLVITGDLVNHASQFAHPDLPSNSDAVPVLAARSRRELLAGLLSHPGTTIAPTHLDAPFGRIAFEPRGLARWRPDPA